MAPVDRRNRRCLSVSRGSHLAFALALVMALSLAGATLAAGATSPKRYIVVLKDSVKHPGAVAERHEENRGADVSNVYRSALKGYAATLTPKEAEAVERDPSVDFVEPSQRYELFGQEVPTGIQRVFAAENDQLSINGFDSRRVDADVAVIDTGVDLDHPDLNVVASADCTEVESPTDNCTEGGGDDWQGHGTHVAGTIGAIDNQKGVVGVAPGARIWSVRVFGGPPESTESAIIAGIDWVAEHSNQIEVANMSFGCYPNCPHEAIDQAIEGLQEKGVVAVVAAGNEDDNVAKTSPANNPDVITVSAISDFDGKPASQAEPICSGSKVFALDDGSATFSNWGSGIDIAAPGVCITSTYRGGGLAIFSGTSMATPHVVGAAAILASADNPSNAEDVEDIRDTLVSEGNEFWADLSGDEITEPLLDVSNESVFEPSLVPGEARSEFDVDHDFSSDLVTLTTDDAVEAFGGGAGGFGLTEGTISLAGEIDSALPDSTGSYVVDAADVDGDAFADLVTVNDTGAVSMFPGDGSRSFGKEETTSINIPPVMSGAGDYEPIAVADVTGDEKADLVVFDGSGGSARIGVFKGQSAGGFANEEVKSLPGAVDSALLDGSGQYFLDVADVNGDGRADLVSWGTDELIRTYLGESSGGFGAAIAAPGSTSNVVFDDGEGLEPVGLGDVDGNDRADLVVYSDEEKGVAALKGQADGTFSPPLEDGEVVVGHGEVDSSLLDGSGGELVGLLDYNADGMDDLVSVGDDGTVFTYLSQGNGVFDDPVEGAELLPSTKNHPTGYEFVSEKPFVRRSQCSEGGCEYSVPPRPEREWSTSEVSQSPRSLDAVSCVDQGFCMGVGSRTTYAGTEVSQARLWWTGQDWERSETPSPSGASSSRLTGVACTSYSQCIAVGSYVDSGTRKPLAMKWSSSTWSWSLSTVPVPSGAKSSELTAMSCTSASNCLAVGSYVDSSGTKLTFAVQWNGTSWSQITTPGVVLSEKPLAWASASEFTSIDCAGASACMAVGGYVDIITGEHRVFAMNWTGKAWVFGEVPAPSEPESIELTGVSCPSSNECVTIGDYEASGASVPLAATWNGSSWSESEIPLPSEAGSAALKGVSCSAASECVAAGEYESGSTTSALALAWNGTEWTEHTFEEVPGASESKLAAVSCTGPSECNATGSLAFGGNAAANAAYSLSETQWYPTTTGGYGGELRSVSCVKDACMAGGDAADPENDSYGLGWLLGKGGWSGSQTGMAGQVTDVSCTAANACTGVGRQYSWSDPPQVVRWNGFSWTKQTAATPSERTGFAQGVSCASATSCVMVGYTATTKEPTKTLPLAEIWNGSSWSLQSVPAPEGAVSTTLVDVSCTSASACTSAGSYTNGSQKTFALIERWNGSSWSVVSVPAEGENAQLTDVSCTSSSECTAVGFSSNGTASQVLRWDGSSWKAQSAPAPEGASATHLLGVSCDSSTECVAVGKSTSAGVNSPLLMGWDGSSWSLEAAPELGAGANGWLESVSCVDRTQCVAVGRAQIVNGPATLLALKTQGEPG
jgi:subtilisin family serine protease